MPTDSDRDWKLIGALDPYFGVLTEERFRRANLDEKALAEFFASGSHDLEAVVVRLSAVYGQRDKALLPLYRMGKLGIVPVYGDGENLLSWLHVHDAASGIVAATMASPANGAVYTVSDGGFYTWTQLVQAFGRAWGRMPRIVHGPPVLFHLAGSAGGLACASLPFRRARCRAPAGVRCRWDRRHSRER